MLTLKCTQSKSLSCLHQPAGEKHLLPLQHRTICTANGKACPMMPSVCPKGQALDNIWLHPVLHMASSPLHACA